MAIVQFTIEPSLSCRYTFLYSESLASEMAKLKGFKRDVVHAIGKFTCGLCRITYLRGRAVGSVEKATKNVTSRH